MEALLVLIVAGIIFGPFILAAFLFSKVNRLERQLEATTTWMQQQIDGMRHRFEGSAEVSAPARGEAERSPAPAPDTQDGDVAAAPSPIEQPQPEITAEATSKPAPEPEPEPATLAYEAGAAEASQTLELDPEPEPDSGAEQGQESIFDSVRTFDFEDIFGRRLPIWAGGVALAVAGIFLVRYAIEAGLLTPTVRVALSFLFGLGLIGGAEAAYRYEDRVRDERVRQALAGAGIATLFGAFYLAGTNYGLIGAGAAFLGLAAVTAAAIALSFRFGLPCAILGLVGGFAAPVLVESDGANVPLLSAYLALVTGGLAWTGVKQGHRWIGYAALAAGLGWGVLMQLSGLDGSGDLAALGLYLVVLGSVLPAVLAVRGAPSIPQLAAAGVATLQMAVLVGNAGFEPLIWGLYLLIGAALAAMGLRYPSLRTASAMAAFVGLWLLGLWPDPTAPFYALVTAAMAAIFAGMPLFYQIRGEARTLERAQIALSALGLGAAAYIQFGSLDEIAGPLPLAGGLMGLALLPIAAFAVRWRSASPLDLRDDLPLLGSAFFLLFTAIAMLVPMWAEPIAGTALGLALLTLLRERDEEVLLVAGWSAIAVSLIALLVTPDFESEALRLVGQDNDGIQLLGLARWAACCLPPLALGALRARGTTRPAADMLAAILAYGAVAQVAPIDALAWLAALSAIALFTLREDRAGGWGTLLAIAGLWTLWPLTQWITAAMLALAGEPFLATDAIVPYDIALRTLPLIAAAAVIGWRITSGPEALRGVLLTIPGTVAMISLHSLYKLAWGVTSMLRFEWYGMGERTIWTVILVGAGYGAVRLATGAVGRLAKAGILLAALAHFAWFTLILHNPLHSVQHVGPTPIANWLPLAYGSAIAAFILLRSEAEQLLPRGRQLVDIAIMVLISLLAVSLLRQVFAGSVLTAGSIGQTESLLLSLLGIALALGFLWWGSRVDQRIWRLGSLVLMLGAVLKVFLIDAAGLDGLLRIASFMALGFSLIGIGWVYSRQLRRREPVSEPLSG